MALLEAQNLSFGYTKERLILSGLNMGIEAGEFVALLGANGSGKTTLLRLFAGLLKSNSGLVLLGGKETSHWKPEYLYRKIGFVFQDSNDQLFANTVAQDVSFGPINMGLPEGEVEIRVERSLKEVGMEGWEDHPIHDLSFGQKRRVALAGVLAMEPEVIFLDEPASGLDAHTTIRIMHLLQHLNKYKGVTFLMATHDVDLAFLYASRVDILAQGRIAISGTPASAFSRVDILRQSNLRVPQLFHAFKIGAIDSQSAHLPITLEELPPEGSVVYNTSPEGGGEVADCAAGAKAAAGLLFHGEKPEKIELRTPSGNILSILIKNFSHNGNKAWVEFSGENGVEALRITDEETISPGLEIRTGKGKAVSSLLFQSISDALVGLIPDGKGVKIMIEGGYGKY